MVHAPTKPVLSVIIPIYNLGEIVVNLCKSFAKQTIDPDLFEVIFVDDGSTDDTLSYLDKYLPNHIEKKIIRLKKCSGPGSARNAGVSEAAAEYLLFVDGDDCLSIQALEKIVKKIETERPDAIAFNYLKFEAYEHICNNALELIEPPKAVHGLRKDKASILLGRDDLIKDYLQMKCDGSVIYTAMRKNIIKENEILFRNGYHEDIAFIFKIYYFSQIICLIDNVLYYKYDRPSSIVNTVSTQHIDGYLKAWYDIKLFLIHQNIFNVYTNYYYIGLNGIVGVIITKIKTQASYCIQKELLIYLYSQLNRHHQDYLFSIKRRNVSHYDKVANEFLSNCSERHSVFK